MCPLINFHSPRPIPFAAYWHFGEGNRFSEYRGSIDSGDIETPIETILRLRPGRMEEIRNH